MAKAHPGRTRNRADLGSSMVRRGAIFGLVVGIGPGMVFASGGFFGVFFAMLGFLGGAAFSGVLGMTEGRRRFDQMSLPRFAGWGAVGSLVLSGIMLGTGWAGNPLESVFHNGRNVHRYFGAHDSGGGEVVFEMEWHIGCQDRRAG